MSEVERKVILLAFVSLVDFNDHKNRLFQQLKQMTYIIMDNLLFSLFLLIFHATSTLIIVVSHIISEYAIRRICRSNVCITNQIVKD